MNQDVIDEREFLDIFRAQNLEKFLKFISEYDNYMMPQLRAQGWELVSKSERTVTFVFGTVTYRRRRYKKDGKYLYPVDQKLGIEPKQRISKELRTQIVESATMAGYAKTCDIIELFLGVEIAASTVCLAIKEAATLLMEKEDYRYYYEGLEVDKIEADTIYIEGDGVMLKTKDGEAENHNTDVAHFVVHTGAEKKTKNRRELQNKKCISSLNHQTAYDKVIDYLHNHFNITENTTIITNSDCGIGYTGHTFKQLVKHFKVSRHEHFLDRYHLNKKIKDNTRGFSELIRDKIFECIKNHKKKDLKAIFDTMEGMVEGEKKTEKFYKFKNSILRNFPYTKTAEDRGLDLSGIGVMESQHRKITYRMKKQGMYWSLTGAEAMTQLIIMRYEDKNAIRDLFFGDWREKYAKYQELEGSVSDYLKKSETSSEIKQGKIRNDVIRKSFQ